MSWSLKLITIRGIPIRVHATFLLIVLWAAYIGLLGSNAGWLRGALFMVIFTLLLFLCVVLHELGHSLVAQLFGVKVHDITLWPIGGIARLSKMPERPYQEFLITAAGPAVNIFLALGLITLAVLWITPAGMARLITSPWALQSLFSEMSGQALLLLLAANNALLAVFNLVPAFPMDGGRLLRSLLAALMPFRRATRIASFVGQALAVLMGLVALVTGSFFLGLVAIFVFAGAWQERQMAITTDVLRGLWVRQVMQPLGPRLSPLQTLGEALAQVAPSPYSAYLVVDNGRLTGLITRGELLAALRKAGQGDRLHAHTPKQTVILNPDMPLVWAQEYLQTRPVGVVVENGRAVGLLSTADLARIAEILEVYGQALPHHPQ